MISRSVAVLLLLSAVFLSLYTPFIIHRSGYTLENESSSLYHKNPTQLSAYSYDRSEAVQDMMQELLDAPRKIVLNIKIRNFEEALWEFEEYKKQSSNFDDVVLRLDLNRSAIGDFRRENQRNVVNIDRIIQESTEFEKINTLEIQYRTEENPAFLQSVTYEGREIYDILNTTMTQVWEEESEIVEISSLLELNATRFKEANIIMKEILSEDRKRQVEREQNSPTLSKSFTLSVSPDSGKYGDTMQITGAYTVTRQPEVTLVLDSNEWKTLPVNKNGVFSSSIQIRRLRSGAHTLFATSGLLYSDIVNFTIIPTGSVLTLDCIPGGQRSEIRCSGSLHAGEIPVADAPVVILVDHFEELMVKTSQAGLYEASIDLTPGNHTIQAVFDDPTFPLNPSSSGEQVVAIKPPVPSMLIMGVLAGFGFFAVLGGIWYTRWKRTDLESPPPPSEGFSSTPNGTKDILIRYQDLFGSGKNWYLKWKRSEDKSSLPENAGWSPSPSEHHYHDIPGPAETGLLSERSSLAEPGPVGLQTARSPQTMPEPATPSRRIPPIRDAISRTLRWSRQEPEPVDLQTARSPQTMPEPATSSRRIPPIRGIISRYLRWSRREPEPVGLQTARSPQTMPEPAPPSRRIPPIRDIISRYLRWSRREHQPVRHEPAGSPAESESTSRIMSGSSDDIPQSQESSHSPPPVSTILIRYEDLTKAGESSKAAFLLYQYLIGQLIPIHGIHDPSTLTPREFAARLSSLSNGTSLKSFVTRYEEVRYEGLPLEKDDLLLTYWKGVLGSSNSGSDDLKGKIP